MTSVIGREAELAAVEAFLDGSTDGHAVLAIVGEPGIGKTTIWDEAVARARAGGATVLAARPAEPEARLSFAGLADLLAGFPEELYAAIPDVQREALEVALLRTQARRPPGPRVLGTAFLSLIRELADERAVVIAVDDFHWLDRPSTSALEFALRRLSDERVRAILSVRSGEAGPLARLERDGPGPGSSSVRSRLPPCTASSRHSSAGRSRVRRSCGSRRHRAGTRCTRSRSPGCSNGRATATLLVSQSPRASRRWSRRAFARSAAGTRDALLRAAALAQPDLRLLSAEALAPAEDAGLVRVGIGERIAFVHPLFASAVYSSASLGRRRAAHRALADAVRDPEERARHLALACDGPDERWRDRRGSGPRSPGFGELPTVRRN